MDALKQARVALEVRAKDPKVRMIGLSDDLLRIAAALEEIEVRVGVLAAVALAKHYGQVELHAAELESLSKMSDHAGARHRIGTHGVNCTCQQCCVHRLVR